MSVQKIFSVCFVFAATLAASVFAETTGGEAATSSSASFIALAAGLGMALASFGGALGQGRAISTAVEGIARNPGAQNKIFVPMIIGLALIESLVLLSFVVANGLLGKI